MPYSQENSEKQIGDKPEGVANEYEQIDMQ